MQIIFEENLNDGRNKIDFTIDNGVFLNLFYDII